MHANKPLDVGLKNSENILINLTPTEKSNTSYYFILNFPFYLNDKPTYR